MDQRYIDLYDAYTHSEMSRRDFFDRMVRLTGSVVVATTVISALDLDFAVAAVVDPKDARLQTETVEFPYGKLKAKAYVARPAADAKGKAAVARPGVIVIHENKGLNPHIEDVTRRLALAGYLAMAPDGLSPLGGTPTDEEKAKELIGKLDPAAARDLFVGAVDYLSTSNDSSGSVAAVGFCWGGAMANQLAVHSAKLKGAVAYYGRQPVAEDVPKMKASLMLHYAGKDDRVNEGIPAYEKALKAAGTKYELFMYPGVQHAFHNDTAGERYDKTAAALSWERTLGFFKKVIGPGV